MRIVIDIPEAAYAGCLKLKTNNDDDLLGFCLINATANGTVLSKGHGRLIDADELYLSIQTDEQQRLGEHLRYVYDEIQSAYTVIEADKESAE